MLFMVIIQTLLCNLPSFKCSLNVSMVLTGHSLGQNKQEQMLKQGRQSQEEVKRTYKIYSRIDVDSTELMVTNTRQEIQEQWGLYDGFDFKLDKKLRACAKRGQNYYGLYMHITNDLLHYTSPLCGLR
ncbi:hypothetical protein SUGI_1187080 [Cryptomeria japonica]|nr:hypothetical protein SUGI_1187080 [Cryptomeria japonica]